MKFKLLDRLGTLGVLRRNYLEQFIRAVECRPVLIVPLNIFLILFARFRWGVQTVRKTLRIRFGQYPITPPSTTTTLQPQESADWLSRCPDQPLISIVVPVYQIDCQWLEQCINSVVFQHYSNWELILVDDCSKRSLLTALMKRWVSQDQRIRLISLDENVGITRATNVGIKAATGEFVAFLDHDDELTPDALTWIVAAHNRHPDAEWFYSDECRIDESGVRSLPYFKPAYSPELLLSQMYTCHLSVYSRRVLEAVKGLREGFDGAQDHDLALRISERLPRDHVIHIPRILYLWRALETSTASGAAAKPYASTSGLRAVQEALDRRGISAQVQHHQTHSACAGSTWYRIVMQKSSDDQVTVIIPTRNALNDLRKCIESVRRSPGHTNYEIVVINNQSDDILTQEYLEYGEEQGLFRVFNYDRPFNHSEMHNLLVEQCHSKYLVFLNNDVKILSDNWLSTLIATCELGEDIAGVGARLLYPDGTLQHAGINLGIQGLAGHSHKHLPADEIGYFGLASLLRETSGCTAALLLLKREAFLEVGGFDAETFPASLNDVDLWLRLQQAGFRCLYTPNVTAIHFESKTRTVVVQEELQFIKQLQERWGTSLFRDSFYNPNLPLDNEQYAGVRDFPITDFEADSDQFRCHTRRYPKSQPHIPESAGTAARPDQVPFQEDSQLEATSAKAGSAL